MADSTLTRREFTALAAAAAASQTLVPHGAEAANGAGPTAGAIVQRISAASGVNLAERAVDGFKAGEAGATVRGIAITSMATLDVLRRAVSARLNLVLSLEPTYFGRNDGQPAAAGARAGGPGGGVAQDDPILLAKRRFIDSNGLVIYRLHDQWTERKENEHARALAGAMGWTQPASDDGSAYLIKAARLADLVPQVRTRLKSGGGLRVVGDRDARIQRVVVLPGVHPIATLVATLPSTDLILAGESRDWEGPEYVGDAATGGLGKGLITVGKVVSAEPGMRACADWIRNVVREVPVQWLAAGEPFWRPA